MASRIANGVELTTLVVAVILDDMGPFSNGNGIHVVSQHSDDDDTLVVDYKNTNDGAFGDWNAQDLANGWRSSTENALDGDDLNIYFCNLPRSGSPRPITLRSYSFATGLYTLISSGGPSTAGINKMFMRHLPNGDSVVFYRVNSADLYGVLYNGSWQAPVLIDTASSLIGISGVATDSAGQVHCVYQSIGGTTTCKHVVFDGASFGSPTVVATGNGVNMGWGFYIAATDEVVFAIQNDGSAMFVNGVSLLRIADATGTPTYSNELVTSTTGTFDWDIPFFVALADGREVVVVISEGSPGPLDVVYSYFIKPVAGAWSVSDTIIYDSATDPSNPPLDNPQSPPTSVRLLSDGYTIGLAFPCEATIAGPTSYCGSTYYAEVSFTPTPPDEPTVTFEKTVVGGSAVDTDFTLVLTGHGSPPLLFGATVGHYVTVPAGDYDLTETGPTGYTVVYHHSGGGSLSGNTLTVDDGDDATITAVNTQGGQPEASCGMGAGGAPVGASPVGCFELLRVVATFRPARHLPVRGSNR